MSISQLRVLMMIMVLWLKNLHLLHGSMAASPKLARQGIRQNNEESFPALVAAMIQEAFLTAIKCAVEVVI